MLTFLPLEQIDEMATWKDAKLNEAKDILAYELTSLVHGEEEARKARDGAKAVFGGTGDSEHMPTTELSAADLADGSADIIKLLVASGLCSSNGDARRNIQQGGITVDDKKVTDISESFTEDQLKTGIVIRRGKKNYMKVILK
jgi:tyrosyl-tRNA synthetase